MTIQKPDEFELFEGFVNGRLSIENTKLFKYWILKDPLFAEKIEQYKNLFSGLKALRIQEIERLIRVELGVEGEDDEQMSPLRVLELQRIEDYFQNQLSQKEALDFEYRVNTDPQFAKEVSQYELIFNGLRETRMQELEKALKEAKKEDHPATIQQTIEEKPKETAEPPAKTADGEKRGIIRYLIPAIAAAAAVLIYFAIPSTQISDADFYAGLQQNYQEQPLVENLMSASPEEDKLMAAGLKAIRAKKYTEARAAFEQVTANEEATLYLGHAYFGERDYSRAMGVYQLLQSAKNLDYRNEADWFLAQCFLKDLPARGRELELVLQKITATDGPHNYKRKASKLYEELISRK